MKPVVMPSGEPPKRTGLTYAADLHLGERFELGSHAVDEAEIIEFAARWDPQWFHLHAAAAAEGPFGGLIGSGLHSVAILNRMTVDDVIDDWAVIAARGMRDLEFRRPLRPGDVLTGNLVVEAVQFDVRARALVTTRSTLLTQEGQLLLTVLFDIYLHANSPDAI